MCGEIPSQAIQLSKLYQTLLNSDFNVGFWFWLSNFFLLQLWCCLNPSEINKSMQKGWESWHRCINFAQWQKAEALAENGAGNFLQSLISISCLRIWTWTHLKHVQCCECNPFHRTFKKRSTYQNDAAQISANQPEAWALEISLGLPPFFQYLQQLKERLDVKLWG